MVLNKKHAGYLALLIGLLIAVVPGVFPDANAFQIIARYGIALAMALIGLRFAVFDPMNQRAEDELDEALSKIPYADGTVPDPVRADTRETSMSADPEEPVRVSETASIAEKMAARAERVRRAKEQGKL